MRDYTNVDFKMILNTLQATYEELQHAHVNAEQLQQIKLASEDVLAAAAHSTHINKDALKLTIL
ncbi:hypothetical protein EJF36_10830 [Bacillus sp. HMF5848]|uniref:hypothetical protein n=1 Tax=Bacillus sp. HMF5848 TaxID=2495421 RepID=UPI000F77B004|nr:hypothetical protein [Bacillus sp. HMF5848]RSK27337.1 hypothetical protein EJF36_10830 [Bacillus sp. HMF5848]